jgi:flagellar biosynthesis anti-sigma factor FlgM
MRIDINSPAASLLSANWNQSQAAKKVSGGAENAAGDRTSFSTAGNMIQTLTAQALNMPEVRQDRVEALRQSIASGAYPLDATGIAAAIVSSGDE